MKYLLSLVCLVALSNSVFSNDALDEPVSKHGKLSVDGINLVNESGEKVQLKGMSLAWSIWWPQFYNEATVEGIKNYCHSNVVRAPLAIETNDGGYLTDPEGQMQLIVDVIEAAIKNDIYVIVDWHEEKADTHLEQAVDFFDKISKQYGSYPNIIYETFNEPTTQSWSDVLKPYHEAVIKAIRANDPDNLIIVGTPTWSQSVDQAAADPITDQKNIMYSLHFYAGTHKQWLRDTAQSALDAGIGIFVNEYGTVNADASAPVDLDESKLWWAWLDENNISYVNYDITDKDEGASALIPGTTAENVCKEEYLTESGRLAVEQNKK
uniref:Glycoside hydrolase family 5 subfamily 2 n=1 Tax=Apriona japonica TaxID=692975 RepID=X2D5K5_9CUCU|nr:glycoside hydrolase family 5 subfamily 2 [Apriona japonica]